MGGDLDLEELSLWKKLKESPLQKEVQASGWLGMVIDEMMTKEQLASINQISLVGIQDGGRRKHSVSLQATDKPGRMVVAKHLR